MSMQSDAGTDGTDEADAHEQQRPAQDAGIDPERIAADPEPDGARIDADPADVQDQSTEATDEDE